MPKGYPKSGHNAGWFTSERVRAFTHNRRPKDGSRNPSWFEPQYVVDESFFDAIDSEAKAYWLGFLTADGCVWRDSRLTVGLAAKDRGHLEKLLQTLGSNCPISEHQARVSGKVYACAYVSIHSRHLVDALAKYGVGPRKSLTVRPTLVPEELARHYWRGVFDGDGSIPSTVRRDRTGPGAVRWVAGLTGNPAMCMGFIDFLAGNGIACHLYKYKDRNACSVHWGGKVKTKAVVRLLYEGATIYLDRKMDAARQVMAVPVYRPWSASPRGQHVSEE